MESSAKITDTWVRPTGRADIPASIAPISAAQQDLRLKAQRPGDIFRYADLDKEEEQKTPEVAKKGLFGKL